MRFTLAILSISTCFLFLVLTPVAHAKRPLTNVETPDKYQDAQINLQKSQTFFQSNGKKTGIKTLPNGVQYKILKNGQGNSPTQGDYVSVYYKATLLDGSLFTQIERPQPANILELSATIPGLAKALEHMKPGARWIVYIPPQLAYGLKGIPNKVPSNAALIFDIELVAITTAPDESVTGVLEELKED